MQLIFETDNTNINISNKMTTLEQNSGEALISNGDAKEFNEEAIIDTENSVTNKRLENKENMTVNTKEKKDSGVTNTVHPVVEDASSAKTEVPCGEKLSEENSVKTKELIKENSETKTVQNGQTKEDEKSELGVENKLDTGDEEAENNDKLLENGDAESPVANDVTNDNAVSESITESQMEVDEKKDFQEDIKESDSTEEAIKTQNEIVEEAPVVCDDKEKLQSSKSIEPEMEMNEDKELSEEEHKNGTSVEEPSVSLNGTNNLENSDDLVVSQMEIDENNDTAEESNVTLKPMEVESSSIGQNLEKQVTESLSALVSEIVEKLDEPDIADGLEFETDNKKIDKNTPSGTIAPSEHDEKTESAELDDEINQDDKQMSEFTNEDKVVDSDQQKKKPEQTDLSGSGDDKENEAIPSCGHNNSETSVPLSNEENELKETNEPDGSNSVVGSSSDTNTQNDLVVKSTESKDSLEKLTSEVPIISKEAAAPDSNDNMDKENSSNAENKVAVNEENSTATATTSNEKEPKENSTATATSSDEKEPKNENSENTANKITVAEENTAVKESVSADVEEVDLLEDNEAAPHSQKDDKKSTEQVKESKPAPLIKLSNTMDILSDDEDELPKKAPTEASNESELSTNKTETIDNKQCINLDDDDDVMVIDEDVTKDDKKAKPSVQTPAEQVNEPESEEKIVVLDSPKEEDKCKKSDAVIETDSLKPEIDSKDVPKLKENITEVVKEKPKPLVPDDFFKTYRKNLADMTRDDLEEFCILKIVESIIDRSNLNEIRSKIKTMAQTVEEYKKKASTLTKQNRDLQVVLKSVQEEQKKQNNQSITPLKIMRSVGMQVLMTDKVKKRPMGPASMNTPSSSNVNPMNNTVNNTNTMNNRQQRNMNQSPRGTPQKQANNSPIPVPRLVPAAQNINNRMNLAGPPPPNAAKNNHAQNVVKMTSPSQKAPEKRPHASRTQSVTVDLTDDEPPLKVPAKNSPVPPVRVVNAQNILAHQRPALLPQAVNSPRKVYIPININTPTGQNIRPGGPRARGPAPIPTIRPKQNMPIKRVQGSRHPAPLPDAMKQYQPPNWKALPPAPDLKLSKVENGIVISWKIEGYQEDSYEEIASYQLYAYQETSAPPSTALWKKIGDVKALPLPMACTLTQFMAGYKYYFAVRAVDIRSRLGPFSFPGSILLLNKM